MRHRRLGRTGLMVSEISLGTVEIGLDYGIGPNGTARRPAEPDANRLLNQTIDSGVNLIDTARAYGESESIIGRALRGRRHEYVLCSKVLAYPQETGTALRQLVTDSVNTSLRELATDTIDIMMIHSAPLEVLRRGELLAILQDLKQAGRFRFIGASVYGEEAALEAIRSGGFDCLQIACSALDRRPEQMVCPEALRHDVAIVARSVLLKGVLTERHRHLPPHLSLLGLAAGQLQEVADNAGVSLPELAYRYVLANEPPHTALVGASTIEELDKATSYGRAGPLPQAIVDRIRQISVGDEEYLNPGTWGIA